MEDSATCPDPSFGSSGGRLVPTRDLGVAETMLRALGTRSSRIAGRLPADEFIAENPSRSKGTPEMPLSATADRLAGAYSTQSRDIEGITTEQAHASDHVFHMSDRRDGFIKSGNLPNVSAHTVSWYKQASTNGFGDSPSEPELKSMVIRMREAELKATGCAPKTLPSQNEQR